MDKPEQLSMIWIQTGREQDLVSLRRPRARRPYDQTCRRQTMQPGAVAVDSEQGRAGALVADVAQEHHTLAVGRVVAREVVSAWDRRQPACVGPVAEPDGEETVERGIDVADPLTHQALTVAGPDIATRVQVCRGAGQGPHRAR